MRFYCDRLLDALGFRRGECYGMDQINKRFVIITEWQKVFRPAQHGVIPLRYSWELYDGRLSFAEDWPS